MFKIVKSIITIVVVVVMINNIGGIDVVTNSIRQTVSLINEFQNIGNSINNLSFDIR